jgi:hypothetical protein
LENVQQNERFPEMRPIMTPVPGKARIRPLPTIALTLLLSMAGSDGAVAELVAGGWLTPPPAPQAPPEPPPRAVAPAPPIVRSEPPPRPQPPRQPARQRAEPAPPPSNGKVQF